MVSVSRYCPNASNFVFRLDEHVHKRLLYRGEDTGAPSSGQTTGSQRTSASRSAAGRRRAARLLQGVNGPGVAARPSVRSVARGAERCRVPRRHSDHPIHVSGCERKARNADHRRRRRRRRRRRTGNKRRVLFGNVADQARQLRAVVAGGVGGGPCPDQPGPAIDADMVLVAADRDRDGDPRCPVEAGIRLACFTVQRASFTNVSRPIGVPLANSFCRSFAGLRAQSSGMRPSRSACFSPSVLRCFGAATTGAIPQWSWL